MADQRPDCEMECKSPADYFDPVSGLTLCHVHALPYMTNGVWLWNVRRSCWDR